MGGPVNKAAYVFGTGTLAAVANRRVNVMAAVMAGGNGAAIGNLLSQHYCSDISSVKRNREAGLTNIVMGLSFITEGRSHLQRLIQRVPSRKFLLVQRWRVD